MEADKITRRRLALGLSRPALARAAGVDPATLWRWEVGKAQPSGLALRALSSALDELERKQARNARDRAAYAARTTRQNEEGLQ